MHITWRSYGIMVVIVVLGIAAQWLPGWTGAAWRALAASLLVVILLEAQWVRRRAIECVRELPGRLFLGRPQPVILQLNNHGSERLRVNVAQPLPTGFNGDQAILEYDLAPGANAQRAVMLVPSALGTYSWTPLYLRVRGCFGLAWWQRRVAVPTVSEVVPDALTDTEHRVATTAMGDLRSRTAGVGVDFLGLRPYVRGDLPRSVDWKATARTGQLNVRIFAQEQRLELLVLLDCSRRSALAAGSLSRLHQYVNVAARLAERAQSHGDPVGLLVFADRVLDRLPPATGPAALVRLRAALTKARPLATESNLLQAALSVRRMLGNRALIVLFTDLDVEEYGGQGLEALKLLTPKHLPLVASVYDEELEAQRTAPARNWRDPFDMLAALELERAVATNQARARRLGAKVVRARPLDLDRAVLEAYGGVRQQRLV